MTITNLRERYGDGNILSRYPDHVSKKQQEEGDRIFLVNNYSERLTERIDFEIINWINHRPNRHELSQLRNWWKHYKGLPR